VPPTSEDKVYQGKVIEVLPNGDGVIELDPELVKDMGWQEGDQLDYEMKDGKIYITNLTRKDNETK
jgi:formylmethanofuran dehydrogenase subunit D